MLYVYRSNQYCVINIFIYTFQCLEAYTKIRLIEFSLIDKYLFQITFEKKIFGYNKLPIRT